MYPKHYYTVAVSHHDKHFSDFRQRARTESVVSNRNSHSLASVEDLSAHSVRHCTLRQPHFKLLSFKLQTQVSTFFS